MDTIDRKGDVIITRGDTVANGRDGGGKRRRENERRSTRDSGGSQTHSTFKLNRKTVVISINCTEDWNPV